MVSIIARPTKRVREIVPAASGWRAIASIAEATALPSPSARPDCAEANGERGGKDADGLDEVVHLVAP